MRGRRAWLTSTALLALAACAGPNPPVPQAGSTPPQAVLPGPYQFLTLAEAAALEAVVDRLIPPDELGPGGREAGCALFIDRQLAGPFGRSESLYLLPPFLDGTPEQGPQSPLTPAVRLRAGLAALETYCRAAFVGRAFAALPPTVQDRLLSEIEDGTLALAGVNARAWFDLVLQMTMEGFFADPIYGGNRQMAGWRLIGFPGARYDYRDWVERHGVAYALPPVGIGGRPGWHDAG